MYTLYGYPRTRSVRVAWALEEIGLPYHYVGVNLKAGEHLTNQFKALNPAAKIPVLTTPDGTLIESAAIVTYLAEKHALDEFIPLSGTYERGQYEQMIMFLVSELEPPLWNMDKHKFVLPESYRIDAMVATSKWEFERALDTFSALLGDNEYLCCGRFTMVDIIAAHLLSWASRGSKLDLTYDNVKSYAQRVLSRPAYEKAWRNEVAHVV